MTSGFLDEHPGFENAFNGAKVFSATKMRDREELGERITDWIRENKQFEIVDKVVTVSSDAEFHCLAITIFFQRRPARRGPT